MRGLHLRHNSCFSRLQLVGAAPALAWVLVVFSSASSAFAQGGRPPANVAVGTVVQQELATGQSFVGTVMPLRTSNIGSAVDGRVVEYPVNEGDRVKKGDVIAQLLTGLIEIEKAAAEAQLKLAQAKLDQLRVSQADQIRQVEARSRNSKANAEYTAARFRRVETLAQQNTMTEDELQEARAARDQAGHAYQEALLAFEVAKNTAASLMDQAKAEVAAAQEEVNRVEDQIAKHSIRSPFDGYLVAEHTEVGEWVTKGGLVAKVIELDQVDVQVFVPENYVPHLVPGEAVRVEVTALPDESYTGTVAVIVPEADPRSRAFPVKVRLKNSFDGDRPLLRAGMFGRVHLPVGRRGKGLLVHKDALVLGRGAPLVFVVDPDPSNPKGGTARPVQVILGSALGELIEVSGELKPGQKVVVQGNERLFGGESVVVVREVEHTKAADPALSSRTASQ